MNIAETLLHALKDRGTTALFGIPGDFALPFFRVAEDSAILPLITLSHEPGVAFAADACARYSGRPGAVALTWGAGAFNALNAVAAAYAEKSPLVVISGAPGASEARSGLMLHHQVKTLQSQFEIFREVTCDQVRLDDPERAPALIARVLDRCERESRPVYIELPRDCVTAACGPLPKLPPEPVDARALAACADELLARIAAACSPVLMAGVEVRRFGLETKVARLARVLDLPVTTSFMGRGVLAGHAVRMAGTYLGPASEPAVAALVEQSDALLMLGVILSDTNFGVSGRRVDLRGAMLAFDGRVSVGHHVYPEVQLDALIDALLERAIRVAQARPAVDRHVEVGDAGRGPPSIGRVLPRNAFLPDGTRVPLAPGDIAAAIDAAMAVYGKMPIASDIGDCLFTALEIGHTPMVAPGYYATMGFGVPAGIGLQAGTGVRPIVLVGDGAFQMTGWELGNCRRLGLDPIVVVFNNRGWEMLRAFVPDARFNDLDDWRFAELATALGGEGRRVEDRAALFAALDEAMCSRGRFFLIEVMLPRGAPSAALRSFTDGAAAANPAFAPQRP